MANAAQSGVSGEDYPANENDDDENSDGKEKDSQQEGASVLGQEEDKRAASPELKICAKFRSMEHSHPPTIVEDADAADLWREQ
jgi:hypothetical protein